MFDVNEKSYIVVYVSTLENESLCLVCKNGHFYGFKCMYYAMWIIFAILIHFLLNIKIYIQVEYK